jgi:hypothetical protein
MLARPVLLPTCPSQKAAADLGLHAATTDKGLAAKTSIDPSALADPTSWQNEFNVSLEQTQDDIADVRGILSGLVSVWALSLLFASFHGATTVIQSRYLKTRHLF